MYFYHMSILEKYSCTLQRQLRVSRGDEALLSHIVWPRPHMQHCAVLTGQSAAPYMTHNQPKKSACAALKLPTHQQNRCWAQQMWFIWNFWETVFTSSKILGFKPKFYQLQSILESHFIDRGNTASSADSDCSSASLLHYFAGQKITWICKDKIRKSKYNYLRWNLAKMVTLTQSST